MGKASANDVNIKVAMEELSYRYPLKVGYMVALECGLSFSVCPKCKRTLDREYQCYCDRCGQKLDWRGFSKAKIIRSLDEIT